ncbi:MAG: 5'-methylthioadenosine/adenosylhomocysteine nucleosidase [Ruthenibacterium sp.]
MSYQMIGILGAMPDEIEHINAQLQNRTTEKIGGVEFHCGNFAAKNVVLCCAGMGKANAAAATQLLATHFHCDAVIFSGIAGNMTDKISVGDVVIGETLLYHDAHCRMIAESYPHRQIFEGDADLIAAAKAACEANGVRYLVGKIATGDDFVGDGATKAAIVAKCAPDCVEMEGAAVAHIAAKNDVPCVVLRAMSDDANENAHETLFDISAYCTTAAKICISMLKKI